MEERLQVASEFQSARDCCLDLFSRKVRALIPFNEPLGEVCQDFLSVFTAGKVTNITVEDGFARASSMRAYMRGQVHKSPTMASKHFLGEIKALHQRCTQQQKRLEDFSRYQESFQKFESSLARSDSQVSLAEALQPELEPSEQVVHHRGFADCIVSCHDGTCTRLEEEPLAEPKHKGKGGTNAWTLYRKRVYRLSVRAPLESHASFQRRCWQSAVTGFRELKRTDPAAVLELSRQAKEENRKNALESQFCQKGSKTDESEYPLPAAVLDQIVEETPGFVRTQSNEWRAKNCEVVSEPAETIDPVSIDAPCKCVCEHSMVGSVLQRFNLYRQALRSYVRRMSKAKSRGQCVLLVRGQGSPSSSDEWTAAFYVCNAMFKPFNMVCWKCKVLSREPSFVSWFISFVLVVGINVFNSAFPITAGFFIINSVCNFWGVFLQVWQRAMDNRQ